MTTNGKKKQIYEIFRECFSQFPMQEEIFFHCLNYDDCYFLYIESNAEGGLLDKETSEVVGFSAICGKNIRLICVRPSFQRKGYGSKLLSMSEKFILDSGEKEIVLGGEDSELFIGAPNPGFFIKRGYTGEEACVEMKLPLREFVWEELLLQKPEGVTFAYYEKKNRTELYETIARVEADWVQFFSEESAVFCCFRENKIISFAEVDKDAWNILCEDEKRIASIGCVGTVPEERGNGYALYLVALITKELQEQGYDESFIHYTTLESWYGKVGYRTFLHLWLGRKAQK